MRIFIMSFCVLSSVMLSAQDHIYRRSNGNLVITNQHFLDTVDLEGITHIPGNLQIVPSSDSIIHDLNPLSNITHVCTDVDSTDCFGLTIQGHIRDDLGESIDIINLNALSNLQFIGGVGGLSITNTHLQYLGNFPNLERLSGLTVGIGNGHLDSLGSFPALERIETVSLNDSIENLGNFSVTLNPAMETLGDFSALTYIGGSFRVNAIDDRSMLRTLGIFSSLDSIKGDFEIRETSVQTLGDFSSLKYIGTSFSVIFNNSLQNLGDFSSLSHIGAITLTDNAMLGNCCGLPSAVVRAVEGEVTVVRNGDQGNCSSSGDLIAGCVPMLMPKTILVDHVAGEDTFNLNSVFGWTILVDDESWINDFYYEVGGVRTNFMTMSDKKVLTREAGGGETTIYIGYDMNASLMSRVAEFIIEAHDVVDSDVVVGRDTFYLDQNPLPPMLTLITTEDTTIMYDETDPIAITFDVGGTATGWDTVSIIGDNFITLSQYMSDMAQGMVTITATPTRNTTLFSRTTTITFTTIGGTGASVEKTVTITQNPEPPTLTLTTFSDTTIVHSTMDSLAISFVVDGSATGWRASMTGDASFITLSQNRNDMERGTVMIMATPTMNMGSSARTAFINLMTVGGTGDIATAKVTIEQGTSMTSLPTLIHSLASDTLTIPYNGTMATIGFRVGGSATGWMSSIVYTPAGSNFVNLNVANDTTQRGNVDIMATIMPNETFDERTADIILVTTEGDMGEKASDTITIQQSALPPPPELMVSTFSDTTIVYNTTDSLAISFVVGGSATGWNASITGDNFITLSQNRNDMGRISTERETVMITAIPTANDGLTRIDTMILMTTGGVGAAARDTIIITQMGAPPTLTGDILYTVNYDATTVPITFNVGGGATGWRISSIETDIDRENFITSPNVGYMRNVRGEQTLSFTLEVNGGSRRVSTITLETVGGTGDSVSVDFSVAQRIAPPPTLMLTSDNVISVGTSATILTDSIEVTFTVGGGALGWTAAVIDGDDDTNDFVTLSKFSGSAGLDTIKVAVSENTGFSRMDTLEITTMGGSGEPLKNTVVITQGGAPPTLMVRTFEDTTIHHNATSLSITFDLGGGAVGWSGTVRGDNFITLNPADADLTTTAREVSVMATYEANTGAERTDTIIFTTTGGVADTVVITQEAVPTIEVTDPSNDTISIAYTDTSAQTITFDVGGSATGWTVSSDSSFVTLSSMSGDSATGIGVTATSTENTGVARTATITFVTTGQLGDSITSQVMIRQDGIPSTLMVRTFEDTTIHHNATSLSITFDLGGGAVGWSGTVRGDNFITLNPAADLTTTAGEVSVMATYEANTGLERTDTIIFITTGGVADTVVVTQEAVPTIEITDPSNDTISIAYNDISAQTITFDVGGSATGWTASSDSSFVTLSSMSGTSATGIGVMATSTENTGVARTATITFVTTGQLGDSITAQVMITQAMEEPPTLMPTSHTDGDTIRIDHRTGAAQIEFNVGGGATGWTHAITGGDFITLGGDTTEAATMTGGFTVTATPTENTDMDAVERSATIRITTIGGAGDSATFAVTITQSASSFDFRVSRPGGSRMNSDGSFQVDITGVPVGGVALTTADELPIQFRVVPSTADVTLTRSHFIRVDISSTVSTERPTGFDEDVPARTFSANYMVAANNTGAERTGTIVFTARSPVGSQTFTVTLEQVTGGFGVAGTYDFTTQTGDFSLNTIRDPGVGHIAAFGGDPSVTTFAEGVRVSTSNITSLDSLIFLESLTTSNGHLIIEGTHLTSLRGMDNLTRIDGNLVIINNSMLTSLEGLEALTHVGGHVIIRDNGVLTSLAGLSALGTIGGDVTIVDNENLTSCSGSASLAFAIGVVRDRTTPDGLSTTISGNGSDGCNDVDELIDNAPQGVSMLVLTSAVLDTLAHDDASTSSIVFDVAFATWTVVSDETFVTLSPRSGTAGNGQTVTATASANTTGMLRTSTIMITATGADGTTLEEMVTLRQEAPPMLSVAPSSFSLGHDEVGAQNSVVTLGGSATGWTVSSDSSFVTLSSMSGVNGDSATFTLSPNTGQARTATLTITTDGSLGSDSTVTVMITQEGTPMLSVAPSSFSLGHDEVGAQNSVVTLGGSATGWNARSDSAFVDITTSSGVNGDSVTFTLSPNTGQVRTATLMITTDGSLGSDSTVTVMIMQGSIPPMLTLVSDAIDTIAHDSTTANDIEITLGGGEEGWSAASSDTSFIKVPASGTGSMIAVSVVGGANTTGAARTATITITTRGGTGPAVSKMVMLRQEEAPTFVNNFFPIPTFTVSYDGYADFFLIDAGGGATGWTSSIVYTPPLAPGATGFITLNPDMGNKGDDPMVTVTFDPNITGSKRTGTIKIMTTGSKGTAASDTVRITQEAAPTLTLVSNDSIRLGYDEMEEQTIRFNVGGSASSWTASAASAVVNAASETASFVNLNRRSGNLEADSATFTLDINTGAERTEIIGLRTGGSQGPNSTVDVVITQEAVPTIEVTDPGNDTISIAYNDTSAQTITFDVGGSATGWTASSDSSFVTLSSMSGDSATGIRVTATSTKNTGVARTATLMITTDGSLGSDSTVTVVITQGEAPPTLMVRTFEDTTIHHGARESLAITFDLGGSAMGWSGTVRGDNFITLNPADEDLTATGEVTITATYEANTGLERTDTIIFTTTGDVADTVVITQRAAPPTLVVTTNDTTINHHAGDFTITFDLGGSAVGWTSHVTGAGFITINTVNDTLASSGSVTIMATYEANDGLERMDSVILMTTGGISDTVVITQKAVPTLVITTNDMTINHDATGSLAITFELGGSAVGWSGTVRGDNFITLDPADEDLTATAGEVSIMATYEANTGMERTDTIIFTTTGGVADTVVITQSAGPPTLVVTTNDTTINHHAGDFTITFTLGGSAVGWSSEVIGEDDFITFDPSMDTTAIGEVTIMAIPTENTGMERMDTIVFTTTGGVADTVVITQKAVPTLVIATNDTTINHDATGSLAITFTLGGSAVGWSGTVRGDNFITLDTVMNASDTNQTVTITATYHANDGLERTDSVILMTTGGVSDTVVITQRAAPPTLVVTTNDATINHNAGDFTITFELGGSAVGWMSHVTGAGFITFDPSMDTTATGEVTIMAIPTENTGMERMDTIIFTTTGGVSDTVVITQSGAPPTLVVTMNDTTINDEEGSLSVTFTLGGSAVGWMSHVTGAGFITFDPSMDTTATGEVTITAMYEANAGVERKDTIVFTTTDDVADTVVITQRAAPPTLVVTTNDTTINHHATEALAIIFDLGGTAKGWSGEVIGEDDFITLTPDENASDTNTAVTITAIPMENTGMERKDTIVFTTTGGVADTVVITQEGAPPTLVVTTNDTTINHNAGDFTITFTLGGSAVDWTGTVRTIIVGNFITLTPNEDLAATEREINVMATYEANTGLRRKGSIIFTTTGGVADTVVITQSAGPPTLMVSMPIPKSGSDTTIAYGAITNVLDIITFTVRGGAAGWKAAVIDVDDTHNFLTLNCCSQLAPLDGIAGTHTIGITSTENMGETRMDTIVIMTVGGSGDTLKDTIVITQAGAPPTLDVSSPTLQEDSNDTTIAYDVGADPFDIITFEVGGGAESWMAAVIDGDNTHNFLELVEHGGTAGTGIIGVRARENTGGARMDTIVITTAGGTGSAIDTIVVTQEAVPTLVITTNDTTINHDDTAAFAITFNVGGSATGWTTRTTGDFVTISPLTAIGTFVKGLGLGQSTTFTLSPNTGVERTAKVTITTTGQLGASVTAEVTITQSAGPPTLVVTMNDTTINHNAGDFTITFELGGSAVGWSGTVRGDNFITLDPAGPDNAATGEVSVTATYGENTRAERTDTIIFTTGGVADTVVITQLEAPPTLEVSIPTLKSGSDTTIAYNITSTDTLNVVFTVGGGSFAWTAAVIDADDTNNFLTLNDRFRINAVGTAGTNTISIISTENMGRPRMDTVVITTVGGFGDPLKDTIVITQAGAPPTLNVSSPTLQEGSNDTTIAYDVGADPFDIITFEVGGGAESWMAAVIDDDNTNNFLELVEHVGTAGTGIIGVRARENTGGARMDTIVITTDGGTGSAIDTIVVTQEAVPTLVITTNDTTINHDDTAAFAITFNVGGSATGWRAVSSNQDFIRLDTTAAHSYGVGIVATVTPTENMDLRRSATITFVTTGQLGDSVTAQVTITQGAAPDAPALEIINPNGDTVVVYTATSSDSVEIVFTVGGGATGWSSEITYGEGMDKFITLSDTVNAVQTDEVRIKLAVMENGSVERSAKIILSTTGQGSGFSSAKDSLTITQGGAPPTFMLTSGSADTIAHDAETASDITFNVGGGATGWRNAAIVYNPTPDAGGEEFITLTGEEDMKGDVTVTVASRVNTGVDRSAAITVATVGGTGDALDTMITITQSAGPPTLEVSMPTPKSGSDTTIAYGATTNILDIIAFTVGGGATSWTAAVIDDDTHNFLELVEHGGTAGTGIIGVRARENTGGTRMDTVVITTVGGFGDPLKDTIVITQSAGPPIFTLTSDDDETIAYDAESASDITFNVGGGATGWWAGVIDRDDTNDFVTLSEISGSAGLDTIEVTTTVNTGVARVDTVVVGTGGEGEATDTIIITQEAIPTIAVTDPVDGTISTDYNEVTKAITFEVGGSATDWTASSDQSFVTLDITSGASGTGLMATVTENRDVQRTATITITTEGQLGAAKTATVMITQTGALNSPTLSVTTPSGDATVAYTATTTSDSVEIMFTTANATGWESMISYGVGVGEFVTLSDTVNADQTDTVKIKVAVTENVGVERSAKIVFSTTGQTGFSSAKDSLTITQGGAPPTFMLTSDSAETIAYDAEAASDVTFEVGGGATGWWAGVIDGDSDNNFATLSKPSGSAGLDTIKVITTANTGVARVDTIVIRTGGTGEATDTIIVTQEAIPTLMIATFNDTTINHDAIGALSITFTLGGTAKGWMSEVKGDGFITLDPTMNASDTNTAISIMATYEANTGLERTDTIIFTTTDGVADTVVITQFAVPTITPDPAILMVSTFKDTTINHDATGALAITFTLGGTAKGWTSEVKGAGFITLSLNQNESDSNKAVSILATYEANTGLERTDTIIFTTTGGVADTVVITQGAVPVTSDIPTLVISTDDTTINHDATDTLSISFTLGGIAKGWTSEVKGYGFITLDPSMNASDTNTAVNIMATYEVNTGLERTDTIIFKTEGDADTVVITQSAAPTIPPVDPPTLVISTDDTTIDHDVTGVLSITFTLGGTAKGWMSEVKGDGFITLDPSMNASDTNTAVSIMATYEVNTGLERTDTIIFTTTGGVADTVVITQGAVPVTSDLPTLMITTFNDTTINHDATGALAITFTLRGTAKGWTSEVKGDGFITLDPTMNASDTNTAVNIMATYEANTGLERTDTIIFTTTGDVADTVVITQGAVPVTSDLPTLMITTFNDTTINYDVTGVLTITFTLRGSAKGWESRVRGNDFITLSVNQNESDSDTAVTITAEYPENDGAERTDTIIFTTTGDVADTVVITQRAVPHTLIITVPSQNITIREDNSTPITIQFTIRGSATGWESSIVYTPDGADFITLAPAVMNANQTGEVTIRATPFTNPGSEERVAKIVLSTTGPGDAVSDSVTITQLGTNPELGVSLDESLILYPNPTDGLFFIKGLSGALEVHIHDLLGRQVATYSLSPRERTIDVSDLPSGMYVVRLKSNDKKMKEILLKK